MPNVYNTRIGSPQLNSLQLPTQTLEGVIKEATQKSVVMQHARKIRMAAGVAKQSVLASLPDAYWVTADSESATIPGEAGMKQTTNVSWTDTSIVAEEMAVIVPIPDVVQQDANFNITQEVIPLIGEAFAKKLDQAVIFGTDKPSSWPDAIVTAATAAGNTVTEGTGSDIGVDIAELCKKIAQEGYAVNGFVSSPGFGWELTGLRDDNGQPIYQSLREGAPGGSLYGFGLNECMSGAWDPTALKLLAIDWSKFVIGIRQDFSYRVFTEGVITDDNGAVVYNLMQQDSKALRFVMRVGFQCMQPAVHHLTAAHYYPAGLIVPA